MTVAPSTTGKSTPQETSAALRPGAASSVRLVGVTKTFAGKRAEHRAVNSVYLEIPAGTFVTLLGPSGCGKTTTLRMIAGFESPTEGDVLLDGASVLAATPDKRPMSMVFQSYALFPHLSVRDNVAFGLKIRRLERGVRREKVAAALTMMGIEQYADRFPHQLSGGQQQRVALARALVMEPKIVLFDEPLSNLDAGLRIRMRDEIRRLQQRLGLTAVFVTHDQSEALAMSDLIVVMNAGRIEQQGSPTEIYRHPANRFVASFVGTSNFLDGVVTAVVEDRGERTRYRIDTVLGAFEADGVVGMGVGETVSLVVRAEHLVVGAAGSGLPAQVMAVAFDGAVVAYEVETEHGPFKAQAPGAGDLHAPGAEVSLTVARDSLWIVASDGERRA